MKLAKKMKKYINYCLNFKKQMRHLIMQNSFVQKTDGTKYDFNRFSFPLKFIKKIYKYEITLDEAIEEQAELKELINKLNDYGSRISKKKKKKKNRREKQSFKICKKIF